MTLPIALVFGTFLFMIVFMIWGKIEPCIVVMLALGFLPALVGSQFGIGLFPIGMSTSVYLQKNEFLATMNSPCKLGFWDMRLVIGMSGASGAPLTVELMRQLRENHPEVDSHLIVTRGAELTLAQETEISLDELRGLASMCPPTSFRTTRRRCSAASGPKRCGRPDTAPVWWRPEFTMTAWIQRESGRCWQRRTIS